MKWGSTVTGQFILNFSTRWLNLREELTESVGLVTQLVWTIWRRQKFGVHAGSGIPIPRSSSLKLGNGSWCVTLEAVTHCYRLHAVSGYLIWCSD